MTSAAFEAFLAKIYVDDVARAEFLADPWGAGKRAGLSDGECRALEGIDRTGLEMAAESFRYKRDGARRV
jgi:hypothetical protein